jgi:PucR C-terminal helix-turn-helix domain
MGDRAALGERLRGRQAEIERAMLTRVYAISDPGDTGDPAYLEGLRAAVGAALDYGLVAIEGGEARAPLAPPALLTQARVAARAGVSLDTVLRRYFAGYALLGDFLIEEAGEVPAAELKRLLRVQAGLFDRLLAAVSEEYGREGVSLTEPSARRRADAIRRLLAGELVDTTDFDYDFERFHLGVIGTGPNAAEVISGASISLGCRLLMINSDPETTYAWFGFSRDPNINSASKCLEEKRRGMVSVAFGEIGRGLSGWRLTHLQAKAALVFAVRTPQRVVRYGSIALLAAIDQDEVLSASLRQLYLDPLEQQRDGGRAVRQTLRAYFAADRNVTATAAALGVNRRTVTSRLRAVEEALGRPIGAIAPELEVSLRLEALNEVKAPVKCMD